VGVDPSADVVSLKVRLAAEFVGRLSPAADVTATAATRVLLAVMVPGCVSIARKRLLNSIQGYRGLRHDCQ